MRANPPDAFHHLAPDQRLDELAAILATGMRRLLSLRTATPDSAPSDSRRNCLDECRETRLHVLGQLTQSESAEGDNAYEA